jgi:succinate dehydrogenase/fumarate reductase-like Fe-S protein
MRVNGRQQLACTTPVYGGEEYIIEPVGEVIADLVTDLKGVAE